MREFLAQWKQLAIASKKPHVRSMRILVLSLCLCGALSAKVHAAESVVPPVEIGSRGIACGLLQPREIESHAGIAVILKEPADNGNDADRCSWIGASEEASVTLTISASEEAQPEGAARERFDGMIEAEKSKHQPGEFVAVPELADDAWALDLSDNPKQYFEVYLLKGETEAFIATSGIGLEATVAIAREAAGRM